MNAGQCKLCVPALDVLLVTTHQASQHMFEAAYLRALGVASLLAAACVLHAPINCRQHGFEYMTTALYVAHALRSCACGHAP